MGGKMTVNRCRCCTRATKEIGDVCAQAIADDAVHTDQRPKTIDLGLKICLVIKDILRRRSTSLEFFVAS